MVPFLAVPLQVFEEEVCYAVVEVVARLSAIDEMVAVGIDVHVELLAVLD